MGDGQRIHWETSGNPGGLPAVFFHGGPGSGAGPAWRRYFNPDAYRSVLFDQRGCGRSVPYAGEPAVDLSTNTTSHLLADVELLRESLGVDRWLVLGGSWGSTLGLAYAERFPERVAAMVLFSVVTTTHAEVLAATRDLPHPVDDYRQRLLDPNPAVHQRAAVEWCEWEQELAGLRDPRYDDARFRLAFSRLVTHYWHHAAFLEDGSLLRDGGRLAGIPGVLIHGSRDPGAPLDIPRRVHAAWPGSKLEVLDAGHGTYEAVMQQAVVDALDRYASGRLG